MTDKRHTNSSRRFFFLRGGAALGAGLASATAGAGTLVFDESLSLKEQLAQLHQQLGAMEHKEAIRQLQAAYTHLLENQAYEAVVELFSDEAMITLHDESYTGKEHGIRPLFTEAYAQQQVPDLHTAFRQDHAQRQDEISVSEDLQSATATFHFQVEVSKPYTDTSVLGKMARQQGQHASRHWETGKFEVAYSRVDEQWKISKLAYLAQGKAV
jgi:hypothetical protein